MFGIYFTEGVHGQDLTQIETDKKSTNGGLRFAYRSEEQIRLGTEHIGSNKMAEEI